MVKYNKHTGATENVEALSEEAIACRVFRHAWKPYTATKTLKGKAKGWNVTLICDRGCGTMKHFLLSQRGEYGHPRYSYDKEYLLNHTPDASELEKMRLIALSDLLKSAPTAMMGA